MKLKRRLEARFSPVSRRGLFADNVTANAGSGGSVFATDDISSVHYPRTKLVHGADGSNDGDVANANPLPVKQIPYTSGGLSISHTKSAANTTGIVVKGSAGQVYGFICTNTNASARYVKFYNKATAATVGTDTPVFVLMIPGNANGAGMVAAEFTSGIAFATGISIGITTGVADSDTGAPAANEIIANVFYK